ncbi:uncharacterized protein DUF3899 [Scopulibacillus darangshiensis]|uniref:Uncharacterized protein DUF3899 n=1 Tax=Scopulibacillus darangshiensis TaxID=442528 RepID=A0A4R2P7F7_9BACL|nr:DUF3899 domain-containing protein [Scopulibacillus darangshiensis]TCP29755.1 uncharacterized protein DUF3899 [Scopulibacillus darangshiensis]
MTNKLRNSLLKTAIAGIILMVIVMFFFYDALTRLSFINSLFNTGLILLVIGCIIFVIQGGFFNGFVFGFKRFFNSISRKASYIKEIEDDLKKDNKKEEENYIKKERSPSQWSCMIIGVIFLIVSFVLSYSLY